MIELEQLAKTYRKSQQPPIKALDDVSLNIAAGELVAILGPSGSGKTTLMNVLGLLARPDAGEYRLNGAYVSRLADDELARLRNRTIGFVFQSYHLLPRLTALENVWQPLMYGDGKDYGRRAERALDAVGLADRADHFPGELSGGQQQRAAIARAIVNEPELLLADEPTGNLDAQAAAGIVQLFKNQNARGTTVILITHDAAVARHARRVIRIANGAIRADGSAAGADAAGSAAAAEANAANATNAAIAAGVAP